jgi:hypothetical protein
LTRLAETISAILGCSNITVFIPSYDRAAAESMARYYQYTSVQVANAVHADEPFPTDTASTFSADASEVFLRDYNFFRGSHCFWKKSEVDVSLARTLAAFDAIESASTPAFSTAAPAEINAAAEAIIESLQKEHVGTFLIGSSLLTIVEADSMLASEVRVSQAHRVIN